MLHPCSGRLYGLAIHLSGCSGPSNSVQIACVIIKLDLELRLHFSVHRTANLHLALMAVLWSCVSASNSDWENVLRPPGRVM